MPGGNFNHPAGNSFLKPASAFRDIANVGALCRQLRTRLREGRVWKALAERFTLRCCLKICDVITFDQLTIGPIVFLFILPLNFTGSDYLFVQL